MVSAVIVAAGSSRRMGFDKLFANLAGQPVIAHSIAAFENTEEIGEIVLVTREDRKGEFETLVASEGYGKVRRMAAGGEGRLFAVGHGLEGVDAGAAYVPIQEGPRPLTPPAVI